MRIHELINEQFETVDDITVALAEVVTETDELVTERDNLLSNVEELTNEVNSLKEKNLQLLSMIPSEPIEKVEDEIDDDVKEDEKIELEDLFEEDEEE